MLTKYIYTPLTQGFLL